MAVFPAGFPTSKLVSAYFFDTATSSVVYDEKGASDIDLSAAASPNITHTRRGVRANDGLMQTPALDGVRAVTILYRTGAESGYPEFIVSGGSGATDGLISSEITVTDTNKIGASGFDMHTPAFDAAGKYTYEMNRGHWQTYHYDMGAAYTSIFGFGGSHSSTSYRAKELEVNCAFFWNATLTDAELIEVHNYIRERSRFKGIYTHVAEAQRVEEVVLIMGDRTADGRALIASLTAPDQAADLGTVDIAANSGQALVADFSSFDLHVNQQTYDPVNLVGPEFGVATSMHSAGGGRILKYAVGGSYMSPSATPTWNTSAAHSTGVLWLALRQWQHSLQDMLARGVGFDAIKIGVSIGLNDATSTTFAPSSSAYAGYLQDMLDVIEGQFSGVPVTMKIARPHDQDPSSNVTALANVRSGIAAFASANTNVTMIDTDAMSLSADSVHQDGPGAKALGNALY